jgi:aconitate hydratase
MEYRRNRERYAFLRWGQGSFENFKVVPPETGIVHQVNLEYLGRVVFGKGGQAYPDTLVGTDSHTTMINGLGVLGWGVGGIEAEAAMLGQAISMLIPQVVGFKLTGELPEGATATDLVLRVTEMLREHGVVGKFVEYYGPGLQNMPLADRATIGNMSPEYGATCGIFPVDDETLNYLRFTGRDAHQVELVEAYMKEQGLFHTEDTPEAEYTSTLELDMATVEPSIAGPKRPQDRIALSQAKHNFREVLPDLSGGAVPAGNGADMAAEGGAAVATAGKRKAEVTMGEETFTLTDGDVVIAAITSCTNTSNPSVMVAAGLLAKKAVEKGLARKPWVKTSLAPGSKVVMDYLNEADLMESLEALQFNLVGYGCTTCIGNSGPLPPEISQAINDHDLVATSVLSGNRNFEGRISPDVRGNYLASPPLVVAYALAGTMDIDLYNEPIGQDEDGRSVFLKDIWPTQMEIQEVIQESVKSEHFTSQYAKVFDGDERWKELPVPEGDRFAWEDESTYIKEPPYFMDMPREAPPAADITGARVLALMGDSITTDHISPAGSIAKDSPAAKYLVDNGVEPKDFNSYGSRRGNHEVMMRGTFANVRFRNRLTPEKEGGWSKHFPSGDVDRIYDVAMKYREEDVPTLVIAGTQYGTGSSRDWAAKGPALLGVRAALAATYERIHRSNLIGMGVLPLQFKEGENAEAHGLEGDEVYSITGVADALEQGGKMTVTVTAEKDGETTEFEVLLRLDTPQEVNYYRHGGILQYVLRQLLD